MTTKSKEAISRVTVPWHFSDLILCIVVLTISLGLTLARDSGLGGPHHDEVISLLVAKAQQRDFAEMVKGRAAPSYRVAEAKDWHQYTKDFVPKSFGEIKEDATYGWHPPLAYWLMNTWMSHVPFGSYEGGLVLIWFQVVLSGLVLAFLALRITGSPKLTLFGFALYLFGNSSFFTASWLRQYGLLLFFYSIVLLLSAELGRRHQTIRGFTARSILLGIVCLGGMLTMYTFATISLPVHIVLLVLLALRKNWIGFSILVCTYLASALAFFSILPGALEQVFTVSNGIEKHWNIGRAIGGIPLMYLPVPSSLPFWIKVVMGILGLLLPLLAAAWLSFVNRAKTGTENRPVIMVPLAGVIGAGLVQFGLVALGYFPEFATQPNHMSALWLLTALCLTLLLQQVRWSLGRPLAFFAVAGLVSMQALYVWNLHHILPNVNKSYIKSKDADLVILDNLSRGYLLEMTDVMDPKQKVLVADSDSVKRFFLDGELAEFDQILYLPMDATVRSGKPLISRAAVQVHRQITELPVVHPGVFEAVLFGKR